MRIIFTVFAACLAILVNPLAIQAKINDQLDCIFEEVCEIFEESKKNNIHFKVYRNDYTFSTVFDFFSNKKPMGSVLKSNLRLRTHYDLYCPLGEYEGQGICQFFSLGTMYTWATKINVYDQHGYFFGQIQGQVFTTEPAKFNIYNNHGKRVAIAYLDENSQGFSVVHPDNGSFLLARLTRKFVFDAPDHWTVSLYAPEIVSPILIKVFAAFACDTQSYFKIDN